MKIQFASDLHLEFPDNKEYLDANPLKPEGDVLVLGGDIVPLHDLDMHSAFFNYVSQNFSMTYWIPGNHEYYRSDLNDRGLDLNEKIRENVILINNHTVMRENVKFIFSTLWTNVGELHKFEIQAGYADFHFIRLNGRLITIDQYNSIHGACLDFLKEELTKPGPATTVVVTHHMPAFPTGSEKLRQLSISNVFIVDLRKLISDTQPDFWIYGHDHTNKVDFSIGSTRLRTNQLGYIMYNEQKGFDSGKYLLI